MTLDTRGSLPTPEEAIEAFMIGPDSENDPMMMYAGEKGTTVVVLNGFGPGQLGNALRGMLPKMVEEQGSARWVTFCSEAWAKTFEKAERKPLYPGQLQELHEAGDETISEVVIANGFSRDHEFSATQHFERKDGKVIWGELTVIDLSEVVLTGGIPEAIRPLFA